VDVHHRTVTKKVSIKTEAVVDRVLAMEVQKNEDHVQQ